MEVVNKEAVFSATYEELQALGFRWWTNDGPYLIPLSLWDKVPDGTELVSINGNVVVKGVDPIHLDTRHGLLAFGFVI